jgi:hypothetical protein
VLDLQATNQANNAEVPSVAVQESTLRQACQAELRRYREETHHALPGLNRQHEWNDALLWWSEHRTIFPMLFIMARRLLCIPATSAPSERVFSLASSGVISKNRGAMKAGIAGAIIFVKSHFDRHHKQWCSPLSKYAFICMHHTYLLLPLNHIVVESTGLWL